jgi:hypothetical protein
MSGRSGSMPVRAHQVFYPHTAQQALQRVTVSQMINLAEVLGADVHVAWNVLHGIENVLVAQFQFGQVISARMEATRVDI